jgi:hypothetical protein
LEAVSNIAFPTKKHIISVISLSRTTLEEGSRNSNEATLMILKNKSH